MAKTLTIVCDNCGTEFQRRASEVARSQRLGRRNYCSLKCSRLQNIPPYQTDELSPFRWHLHQIRKHSKKRKGERGVVEVTLEDLKDQWELQKGRCPYTGWYLTQMTNCGKKNRIDLAAHRSSVDRIDSNKGYSKDNIEFVAYSVQMAKHQNSKNTFIELCEKVTEYQLIKENGNKRVLCNQR